MRRPRITPEHEEQVGFINWFRREFPGVLVFAIPNGGKRSVVTARKLKMEGVIAGIPDMFIPAWDLWVEMKRVRGGRVSPEQAEIHAYLRSIGDTVIVGKGAEDASRQVRKFIMEERSK